jgi:hypothetical protein
MGYLIVPLFALTVTLGTVASAQSTPTLNTTEFADSCATDDGHIQKAKKFDLAKVTKKTYSYKSNGVKILTTHGIFASKTLGFGVNYKRAVDVEARYGPNGEISYKISYVIPPNRDVSGTVPDKIVLRVSGGEIELKPTLTSQYTTRDTVGAFEFTKYNQLRDFTLSVSMLEQIAAGGEEFLAVRVTPSGQFAPVCTDYIPRTAFQAILARSK